MQLPVRKAIALLYQKYFEPVTLSEVASDVFVSQFHFSRIFAKSIGMTPGRFLTALRLFEAKRLLVTTSLTVSDVVCSVGYSSVGTFTTRFTMAVGMTPTQYRAPSVGRLLVAIAPRFRRLPGAAAIRAVGEERAEQSGATGSISGTVEIPAGLGRCDVFVGAFSDEFPQSGPVAFTGLSRSDDGKFTLHGVPDGRWYLITVARVPGETGENHYLVGRSAHRVGAGARVWLRPRPPRLTDPPFAVTLAVPSPAVAAVAAPSPLAA